MGTRGRTIIQKIAVGGLILEAVGFVFLTVAYLVWISKGTTVDLILAVLIFGDAVAFGLLAWGMIRGTKLWWILSLLWVGLNLVLTVTDQFGAADWAALIYNGVLLILLVVGGYTAQAGRKGI